MTNIERLEKILETDKRWTNTGEGKYSLLDVTEMIRRLIAVAKAAGKSQRDIELEMALEALEEDAMLPPIYAAS